MKLLTGLLGLSAANANQCCDYIKVNGNGNLQQMNAIFKRRTDQNSETGAPKYERVDEYGDADHTTVWASRERIDYYNHNGMLDPHYQGQYWIFGPNMGVNEYNWSNGAILIFS